MKRRTRIGLVVATVVCAATISRTAIAQETRGVDKPKPPPREQPLRRVTLTVNAVQAISFTPLVAVTSEVRVARRWSFAVSGGGGERANEWPYQGTKLTWQMGAEPRLYVTGDFNSGFYVAWSTMFADSAGARFGFESFAPPPGLSTGPSIGYKSVYIPIITPDLEIGLMKPLVTPAAEGTPPFVALVGKLGFGFSL